MWQGWIGQSIANRNRTTLRISLVLIAIGLIGPLLASRWLLSTVRGPVTMDEQALAAVGEPSYFMRDVVVEGTNVFQTGLTERETRTSYGIETSSSTTAEYRVLLVGSHWLLVKALPGSQGTRYVGPLVAIPDDVKQRVLNRFDADMRPSVLPFMLDAKATDDAFAMWGAVMSLFLVIGLGVFFTWKFRDADPTKHPLVQALRQFGPLESVVPQIDNEMMAGAATFPGSIYVCKSWLIDFAGNTPMRKDEVIWVYFRMVENRTGTHGIAVSKSYFCVLKDLRGSSIQIGASEQQATVLAEGFMQAMPWVFRGFSEDVEVLYNNNRESMIAMVEQRRRDLKSAHA